MPKVELQYNDRMQLLDKLNSLDSCYGFTDDGYVTETWTLLKLNGSHEIGRFVYEQGSMLINVSRAYMKELQEILGKSEIEDVNFIIREQYR